MAGPCKYDKFQDFVDLSDGRWPRRLTLPPRVMPACGAALRSRPYRGHWRWVGLTSPTTFNPAYSRRLSATFGRV
ncbi:hypothetical protein M885DRAFT_620119 [Pelagophyceae sp. CCMP2097]|nr:hypothetical protein M885DRAFT_620119 [Pelagophyceae sp. CCMP2097]